MVRGSQGEHRSKADENEKGIACKRDPGAPRP